MNRSPVGAVLDAIWAWPGTKSLIEKILISKKLTMQVVSTLNIHTSYEMLSVSRAYL